MNPIETLKQHNEWRRGSNTEMLNPTNLGKAIDTVIADYEAMQKQNDELKYQLKIRDDLSCKTCKGAGTVMIAIDDGMECPECAQSLSDIRAEAVGRFIDAFRYEFEGPRDTDSIESFADQYITNRIKEG